MLYSRNIIFHASILNRLLLNICEGEEAVVVCVKIVIHNTLILNGDFLYQRYNVF